MAETKAPMATSKIDDNMVSLRFSETQVVNVNTAELPSDVALSCLGTGVLTHLQRSYLKIEDKDEAFAAASKRANAMRDGTWKMGQRSNGAAAAPDDLTRALAEHFGKPHEYITEAWMPHFLAEHTHADAKGRQKGRAKALEALRGHEKIAQILARYASERAKASRGKTGISLDLDVA